MAFTVAGLQRPGLDGYNEALLPYDLTRGGAPFRFEDRRDRARRSAPSCRRR